MPKNKARAIREGCMHGPTLIVENLLKIKSYLFGIRVPILGKLLWRVIVVGKLPGEGDGEASMLPVDWEKNNFVIYNNFSSDITRKK